MLRNFYPSANQEVYGGAPSRRHGGTDLQIYTRDSCSGQPLSQIHSFGLCRELCRIGTNLVLHELGCVSLNSLDAETFTVHRLLDDLTIAKRVLDDRDYVRVL